MKSLPEGFRDAAGFRFLIGGALKSASRFRCNALSLFAALLLFAGTLGFVLYLLWCAANDISAQVWLLEPILSAERLLPLIGVGLVIGQLSPLPRIGAAIALISGMTLSLAFKQDVLSALARLPGAPAHFFLVGPLGCFCAGAILVLPPRLRPLPALPLLLAAGGFLALAADFSNPGLHDRRALPVGLGLMIWIILAIALPVSLQQKSWTATASRIAGSWLLAIGALYGGAYMAARQQALVPPEFSAAPPADGIHPGFSPVLKAFDRTGPQRPMTDEDWSP
ncbi:hypothetical protein ACQ3G6_00415 [Allorhizobium undicola]|uniref:hypothetical protein n=1 Tax=Allorhizobium undicola TaxID=78527 RepID=UPI003D330292